MPRTSAHALTTLSPPEARGWPTGSRRGCRSRRRDRRGGSSRARRRPARRPTPPPRGPTGPPPAPRPPDHGTIAPATPACGCELVVAGHHRALPGAVPALEQRVEPTRAPGVGVDHQRATPVEPAPEVGERPCGAEGPRRPPPTGAPGRRGGPPSRPGRGGRSRRSSSTNPVRRSMARSTNGTSATGHERLRAHGREGRIRSSPCGQHHPATLSRHGDHPVDEPVPTADLAVIRHPALRERRAGVLFGFGDRLVLAGARVAAGWGCANERKWGYRLAIGIAVMPLPPAVRRSTRSTTSRDNLIEGARGVTRSTSCCWRCSCTSRPASTSASGSDDKIGP